MAKYYSGIGEGETLDIMLANGATYGISPSQDIDCQDIDCRKVTATGEVKCTSTTAPFYPPVVTTTQRNALSGMTQGAVVYDSDLDTLCFYNGSAWRKVTHTAA